MKHWWPTFCRYLSLLYALRHALDVPRDQQAKYGQPKEIHIIVAEASAASPDYSHDRGASALLGSSTMIANGLMLELVAQVNNLYSARHGDNQKHAVQLHYITMPSLLRMRGGLGTHWMLPETVKITNANVTVDEAESVDLKSASVQQLIRDLYLAEEREASRTRVSDGEEQQRVDQVWKWILTDRYSDQRRGLAGDETKQGTWSRTAKALRQSAK